MSTTARESTKPEEQVWNSEDLLRGKKEIVIVHGNERYRLRMTRLGKLILYK